MANYDPAAILDAMIRNLKDVLTTRTIVGEPVQAGNATVMPIIKVSLGFGAGSGSGGATEKEGSGGGGGGGLVISPVGFLVVEGGRAIMLTPKSARWDWVAETIPDMVDRLMNIAKNAKGSGKEPHAGEPFDI